MYGPKSRPTCRSAGVLLLARIRELQSRETIDRDMTKEHLGQSKETILGEGVAWHGNVQFAMKRPEILPYGDPEQATSCILRANPADSMVLSVTEIVSRYSMPASKKRTESQVCDSLNCGTARDMR